MIAQRHLRAALASRRVSLTALIDPVESRARDLCIRFGVTPQVYSVLTDAALHAVDGLIIATPNHLHEESAVASLAAGKPVLIEKPLATTGKAGEAICAAAEHYRTVAAVAYTTRFREGVRLLGKLLGQGYFGVPRRFAFQFGSRGGWSPMSAYNLDRATTGGGVLVVTGTHFLDRMLAWFGYPTSLSLEDDSLGGPEANALATFHFSHLSATFTGTARFSKTIALPPGFVMETDRGLILLRDTDDARIQFRSHESPAIGLDIHGLTGNLGQPPQPAADIFLQQLEDFVEACSGRHPPMVSARDGLNSLRLIEALYESRLAMMADPYEDATPEVCVL